MAHDLKELFNSPKRLTIISGWAELDSEFLQLVAPLEIAGVTVEGLQFRACARKRLPDEMVTCQVEYHPNGEVGGPLARLEWRPMSAHNNKSRGPVEWQNRLITGCHHHRFDLNFQYAEAEMTKGSNLPIAVPLTASPAKYPDVLALVKEEFRIDNVDLIEVPPWEAILV